MADYRKLIAFGKSSFVVSLPKKWVEKHHLKKGSVISFKATDAELVLFPQSEVENKEREIRISVDGKTERRVFREIIAGYMANFNSFVLYGNELPQQSKSIRDVFHNLMAIEILEQTSTKMVAKDFLEMDNLDITSIIKKADMIIRSMMTDCRDGKTHLESMRLRGNDVDRLTFLLYRAVRHSLQNPLAAKNHSSVELVDFYWLINSLERIADNIYDLATQLSKMNKEELRITNNLLKKVDEAFLTTMKAVYAHNKELAHEVATNKSDMIEECDSFLNEHRPPAFVLSLQHIKSIARLVHVIGRTVYNSVL